MKLAEKVSTTILERIAHDEYSIGADMPAETELAEELGVSRLTLREAIKDLAARGVLEVRHGKKNKVAEPENWSVVDPQLARIRGDLLGNQVQWITQLVEARHIIEVGACELAAQRITDEQLRDLEGYVRDMKTANAAGDVTASVEADMNFHRAILRAANNDYINAAYTPLEQVLESVRQQTSSSARVRADAEHWHQEILKALASHSTQDAHHTMRMHMRQTLDAIHIIYQEEQ